MNKNKFHPTKQVRDIIDRSHAQRWTQRDRLWRDKNGNEEWRTEIPSMPTHLFDNLVAHYPALCRHRRL